MCLLIQQRFKESTKTHIIDDIFDVRRQYFPHVLQNLETTSTLEAPQHESLAHYSMTSHMPKKFPCQKKKKKKKNAPPKISPQSKIFTCPYITTKFFFFNQNSYMTKIANKKFPTCPCTTSKFSHVQNHSHKNIFHDQTSHTQQNFSIAKISCPLKLIHIHKICLYPQVYPYSYPQNNFAMFMK